MTSRRTKKRSTPVNFPNKPKQARKDTKKIAKFKTIFHCSTLPPIHANITLRQAIRLLLRNEGKSVFRAGPLFVTFNFEQLDILQLIFKK